jgi:hypothetical protein
VDEINGLIRKNTEYKKVRDDKYRQDSKDRLSKIIKKKVETTMIGALSSIEQHFGFLWENKNGKLSAEQQAMHDLYQKVRSEILDKGNSQARNIDAELSQYDVNWLRYSVNIPVK